MKTHFWSDLHGGRQTGNWDGNAFPCLEKEGAAFVALRSRDRRHQKYGCWAIFLNNLLQSRFGSPAWYILVRLPGNK
jgi:hypothetical protein